MSCSSEAASADTFGRGADHAAVDECAVMMDLIAELYPICRSITGDGVRRSLSILQRHMPLEMHEVPSGTAVLDWTVPDEWNVRDAHIETLDGRRIVDFAASNLHILQYSHAMDRIVPIDELQRHLYSLPEQPDWIPYRTAYYANTWGFCVTQRQRETMTEAAYHVVIDASLTKGHLTYGELLVRGASEEEVLFSCHSCHPSLGNDNLSGMAIATLLARRLMAAPRRFTYRFLFIPGTIGSITWLARNETIVPRVRHGLVLSCLGDAGASTYKQSRQGTAPIDRYVEHVLRHSGSPYKITPFIPYGYDERQYCSPGFNMPVGCFMRSPNGSYPEYHTSADNLDLVKPDALLDSLQKLTEIVNVIEHDIMCRSLNPRGEPQLGRRGLYRPIGGAMGAGAFDQMTLLWVLNLADGGHSLFDIAERSNLPFASIKAAADALMSKELLEAVMPRGPQRATPGEGGEQGLGQLRAVARAK
jgi:aminopeptidase-like protein